ncbi:hypothetical protein PG988_000022 [Apiospora saccharicola]
MADEQDKTPHRGMTDTNLANKRKRHADQDVGDGTNLRLAPPPKRPISSHSSFEGGHSTDTMEEAVALLQRYRNEQRGGYYPPGTTIIIRPPDPMHIAAANRPFQDHPAPARRSTSAANVSTEPDAHSNDAERQPPAAQGSVIAEGSNFGFLHKAPNPSRHLHRVANSTEDAIVTVNEYAAQQPDGKFPRDTVIDFRPHNRRAARNAKRDIEDQRGPPAYLQSPAPPLCGHCGKSGHTVQNCAGPRVEDGL